MKTIKRYFVFSKKAFAKAADASIPKPMRRAATRDEARAHKEGNKALGIWDTMKEVAVR